MTNDQLPPTGFLRENQILGSKETPAIIPVSRTTWWMGIRKGIYPKPVKISARTTAWKVEDIRALVEELGAEEVPS